MSSSCMTISADPVSELVRVGGDLDHLTTDLEPATQLFDARALCDRGAEELTRHEQLTRERICLAFARGARAMHGVEEVMAELVRDREALPHLRLAGDELDPVVDQAGAETAEAFDLDNLDSDEAGERPNGDWRSGDLVFGEHPPRHRARMRRMSLLGQTGPARDSEAIIVPWLVIQVGHDSRAAALRTLIGEARRLVEARAAFFLGASQIGHDPPRIDYRLVLVHRIGGCRGPGTAVISACRREFGDPQPMEGAMDKKESKLFKEVERLRGEDGGLGEKLDRYRQSRGHYERLVKGREETEPSVPLQRSRRRATSQGRIRGIVDGAS